MRLTTASTALVFFSSTGSSWVSTSSGAAGDAVSGATTGSTASGVAAAPVLRLLRERDDLVGTSWGALRPTIVLGAADTGAGAGAAAGGAETMVEWKERFQCTQVDSLQPQIVRTQRRRSGCGMRSMLRRIQPCVSSFLGDGRVVGSLSRLRHQSARATTISHAPHAYKVLESLGILDGLARVRLVLEEHLDWRIHLAQIREQLDGPVQRRLALRREREPVQRDLEHRKRRRPDVGRDPAIRQTRVKTRRTHVYCDPRIRSGAR